jgi:hypothetical protein
VVYDGHLIAKIGLICPRLDDAPPDFGMIPRPCLSSPERRSLQGDPRRGPGDVEFMFMAALTRFPGDPNWRQYELAGVAHIPPSILDLGTDQNPIESAPVIRAALHSLELWTRDGIPAPPSMFLAGSLDAGNQLVTELDADGSAFDGLRPPHTVQVVDGEPASAPLGVYTGINPQGDPPYAPFADTFRAFDPEALDARYPTRREYVDRVARAADRLLADGYLVASDRDAYMREAAESDIGRRARQVGPAGPHGVSSEGGSGMAGSS